MLISIVVPVFNEEDNLHQFYDEILRVMTQTRYQWEVIFVDDGSQDRSPEIIAELHRTDSRIHTVRLSRNFGSYPALNAGLLHAKGDAVVCITADLQDPPALILDFLPEWEKGADIVWGVRVSRDDPGLKSFYANAFYWIVRLFIWPKFPSGGMDCGLFDQRVVKLYNALPVRNTIPFFTIYNMGFRQVQIPYSRQARQRGYSKWGMLRRIKAAIDVLVDFSYVPIRAMSLMGFFIGTLSLSYVLLVIISRFVLNMELSPGWPSTVVIMALLGGLQMVALGVLGEYVWRISEQVRLAPRFFIMGRLGIADDVNDGIPQEHYLRHTHEQPSP